jgi:hypothetical protein
MLPSSTSALAYFHQIQRFALSAREFSMGLVRPGKDLSRKRSRRVISFVIDLCPAGELRSVTSKAV